MVEVCWFTLASRQLSRDGLIAWDGLILTFSVMWKLVQLALIDQIDPRKMWLRFSWAPISWGFFSIFFSLWLRLHLQLKVWKMASRGLVCSRLTRPIGYLSHPLPLPRYLKAEQEKISSQFAKEITKLFVFLIGLRISFKRKIYSTRSHQMAAVIPDGTMSHFTS